MLTAGNAPYVNTPQYSAAKQAVRPTPPHRYWQLTVTFPPAGTG